MIKQKGVVLADPEVTTYTYTSVGSRESQTLPNGITTLYSYDTLNRLSNLTHVNAAEDLLASYDYTVSPTGRRTGVVEQTRQADDTLATRTERRGRARTASQKPQRVSGGIEPLKLRCVKMAQHDRFFLTF